MFSPGAWTLPAKQGRRLGFELSGLIAKKMLKMLCLSSSVFKSHALE